MTRWAVFFCVCALLSTASAQDSLNVRCVGRADYVTGLDVVTLRDNLLYIGASAMGDPQSDAGLWIVDVSDSAQPFSRGHAWAAPMGETMGVAVSGNVAVLAVLGDALDLIDVSDPDSLELVSSLVDENASPMDVTVRDNLAYVTWYNDAPYSGLSVVDISDPERPMEVASCPLDSYPLKVVVSGHYAYVSGGGHLTVVDVSNPETPTIVAQPTVASSTALAVQGNRLYMTASQFLEVWDIGIPSNPQLLGRVVTQASGFGLAVAGNFAFVPGGTAGLRIFDVSDPASIRETGNYRLPLTETHCVAVRGGLVYMTAEASLFVLDCSAALAAGDRPASLLPVTVTLAPAFPNPFNPATTLAFSLPRASDVSLNVFDINGRLVQTLANRRFEAGEHALPLNGQSWPSGIYFARLRAGSFSQTQKLMLVR